MATQHLDDVLSAESGFSDYSQAFTKEENKTNVKNAMTYGVGGAALLGLGYYVFNANKAISLAYILSGAGLLAMSIGSFGLGLGAILGISLASWYSNHFGTK